MTAPKPNIVWRGCPNYWHGRVDDQNRPWSVIAIVDHIMVGTQESTDGWFKNPKSQASSTYGVAKDGRIWQWVNVDDTHWGNGILQQPDMSVGWIAECANKTINPNYRTISIEHEGWPGDVFPEAQYQATLALHRWLLATFNIPADRQHVNGHYQLMKIDKATCPGVSFPWARLMGDLTVANPNPNNYSIGPGMLAELTNRKLTAATPENYLAVQPGQLPQSELFTVEGPVLKGIKKPDNSGQWIIRVLNPA
jgi:hypothetical protein